MSKRHYRLGEELSTATKDLTLWTHARGKVEIAEDTLAAEVILNDQPFGYVFHGHGTLLLDAIVETERGAVGSSVERTLDEPFLMLRRRAGEHQHLRESEPEDFPKCGYENQDAFVAKAEALLDTFFEGSTCGGRHAERLGDKGTCVFAFPNHKGRLDILLAKDASLVYTAQDRVFVMKGEKMVLTSRGRVAIAKPGKSVLIEGNCGSHLYRHTHDG
jgi:hypothetical protein